MRVQNMSENDPAIEPIPQSDEVLPDQIDQETPSQEPEDTAPDYETEAKKQGWKPESEFKGNKKHFVDAKKFLERRQEFLPVLQAENRKFEDRFAQQQKIIEGLQKQLVERQKFEQKITQNQDEQRWNALVNQQKKAFAEGDEEAFDRIENKKNEIIKEQKEAVKPKAEVEQSLTSDPEMNEFLNQNQWYLKDPDLQRLANTLGVYVRDSGYSGKAFYEKLAEEVKRTRPDKFKQASSDRPASVNESDGRPGQSRAKGYESMPPDARAACDRFIAQGLFKNRAEYAKQYFG